MSEDAKKKIVTLELFGYVGVVKDFHYPDNSHNARHEGFKTPEEAAAWAEAKAKSHGYTHISWWVEYDADVEVEGYYGST